VHQEECSREECVASNLQNLLSEDEDQKSICDVKNQVSGVIAKNLLTEPSGVEREGQEKYRPSLKQVPVKLPGSHATIFLNCLNVVEHKRDAERIPVRDQGEESEDEKAGDSAVHVLAGCFFL
jgi:hypothetical protein